MKANKMRMAGAALAALLLAVLSVSSASAGFKIALSTPQVDNLHLEQGERFEFDARVYNHAESEQNLKFVLEISGDFENQVDFSANGFDMAPGTNRQVRVTIRTPWDWEPGETYEGTLTMTAYMDVQVSAQEMTAVVVGSISKDIRATIEQGPEKPWQVVLEEFIRENWGWLLLCLLPAAFGGAVLVDRRRSR